tara:strand:+ start:396 stop:614 length:219 start_codon:yes stop_codon:yes gene_type:complete
VRDYEAAAVRDNSVRQVRPCYLVITPMITACGSSCHVTWLSPLLQVASEPYAYYATRNLQPGDEVTSAFGAS